VNHADEERTQLGDEVEDYQQQEKKSGVKRLDWEGRRLGLLCPVEYT
jgi:hypothetical protein